MRRYRWLLAPIAAVGMAGLAGCAPQSGVAPVSPEQRLAMIPTGEPLLSCRADCLAAWRASAPEARILAARRRWVDLALLVLRTNYEDDLTNYYLAEAAQGMGYRKAAVSYYRQSIELSRGPAACAVYSGTCGGISLPRAASARLTALERSAGRRPPPAEKPAPAAEQSPAAPAVEEPSVAPVRAPSPEERQFIEPPPAHP